MNDTARDSVTISAGHGGRQISVDVSPTLYGMWEVRAVRIDGERIHDFGLRLQFGAATTAAAFGISFARELIGEEA